jgi:predicted metal-dependent hydrolase
MQLDLPFLRASSPGQPLPPFRIDFVRTRRARRYILRVQSDGRLRVTLPRGGSKREAMAFVETQRRWIERERARVVAERGPVEWDDGSAILVEGRAVPIVIREEASGRTAIYADRRVPLENGAAVRDAIEADLRTLARERLVPRLSVLASAHGLQVARVTIRNQRSRWGSCSPAGAIALNFRLVQVPPEVRDYVLVHELMHLRQQNHSRRFWRLVEAACPGFRDAERWLKVQGKALF